MSVRCDCLCWLIGTWKGDCLGSSSRLRNLTVLCFHYRKQGFICRCQYIHRYLNEEYMGLTDEYMGRLIWLWAATYIRRWNHITEEYTCTIFIGDMASLMNIWGIGLTVTTRLYSSVKGALEIMHFLFSLSRATLFHSNEIEPPLRREWNRGSTTFASACRLAPLPPLA
jgi:hypothetical protein